MKHFTLILMLAATAFPQVADKANRNYKSKEGRERVAATLGSADRDARQKPNELAAAMNITPGITVADVGTGIGYMLPFLSRAVGANGKVFAEDIQTDFLDKAKAKADRDGLGNVQFFLGDETDPRLPANSVDLMLILDTYHHFDYPDKMLANILRSLRPAGRLVIVDFYKHSGPEPGHVRLDPDGVVKEVTAVGFDFVSQREHIPNSQFMLTFRKK